MTRIQIEIGETLDQTRGEILVQQQFHTCATCRCRSRSAA
jgi:hypothetical protein